MAVYSETRFLKREKRTVKIWIADYRTVDGRRPRPEFPTKKLAEEALAKEKLSRKHQKTAYEEKLLEDGRPLRKIRDMAEFYMTSAVSHWREESRKDLRSRVIPFVEWCELKGIMYAHQMNKQTATAYRDFLLNGATGKRGRQISRSTMQHWLIAASNVFEADIEHQEPSALLRNPFRQIKKTGYAVQTEPVIIEQSMVRTFLSCCPETEYHLFRLEYGGGFRAGEITNLTWSQIRDKRISLRAHDQWEAKTTESAKSIAWNDLIEESIRYFRLRTGHKKYVLDIEVLREHGGVRGAVAGRPGKNFISRRFNRVKRLAVKTYPDFNWEDFTPHKLRAAYGSHLAELGVPLIVIQKLMRHRNFMTTVKNYVNVSDRVVADGALQIAKVDLSRLPDTVEMDGEVDGKSRLGSLAG